jgi:nucleotide-binding universal stress UspA family protein
MALKGIAVLVDPTSEGDNRLRLAATLAQRHDARLTGFHVVPGTSLLHSFVRGHCAIQSMIERWMLSRQRDAVENGKQFTRLAAPYRIKTDFRVIWNGDDLERLNSLPADLLVIGNKKPLRLQDNWRPENLLAAGGVPLLVVPSWGQAKAIAERILIAWNGSKEARRAAAAAMPLLKAAHSVTILMVDGVSDESSLDLARHFARHGVQATIEQVTSAGAQVADVILSDATQRHADVIVIGAYSHAKPMRLIFGGVTQSILRKTTMPILMSR